RGRRRLRPLVDGHSDSGLRVWLEPGRDQLARLGTRGDSQAVSVQFVNASNRIDRLLAHDDRDLARGLALVEPEAAVRAAGGGEGGGGGGGWRSWVGGVRPPAVGRPSNWDVAHTPWIRSRSEAAGGGTSARSDAAGTGANVSGVGDFGVGGTSTLIPGGGPP